MTSASTDLIKTSLVDQIIQRTFGILAENPNVDPELVQQLRDLAKVGDLKRHGRVASVLKSTAADSE